jgi:hypothetical protein
VGSLVDALSREDLKGIWADPSRFAREFGALWAEFMPVSQHKLDGLELSYKQRKNESALNRIFGWLIAEPEDLERVTKVLASVDEQREFLNYYMRHDLADDDVIRGFLRKRPYVWWDAEDPDWLEVAILRQGAVVLTRFPDRKFYLEELILPEIDLDRSAFRSVVGFAVDENQLQESDFPKVLELFPDDAYLRTKLSPA